MSDIDDHGVESQFIDPFTPSLEAYPFPVEEFMPQQITKNNDVNVPETPLVIPTMTDNGTVVAHNTLKVTPDDSDTQESPALITDTPTDPLDKPGSAEVRISLEDDELKEANDTLEVLAEIVKIRDHLTEIASVSKDDVIAFEAYFPGDITDKVALNRFSSIPTPVGLSVSLETITNRIIVMVKNFIQWVIRQITKLIDWVLSRLEKIETNNLHSVIVKWQGVENRAKRIDSTGNGTLFKKRYSRFDYAAKSATTHHFIILHANAVMKRVLANFNVGMLNVQNGALYGEAKALVMRMSQTRSYVTTGINNFKTSRPIDNISKSIAMDAYNAADHSEYLAKLKANYSEPSVPIIKEYKNAISVKDIRAAVATDIKTLGDSMVSLRREIATLDDNISKSFGKNNIDTVGFHNVKEGLRILVSQSIEMDLFLNFFTRYCTAMMTVAEECDHVVVGLHLA